jgi:hypothetical protein
VPRGLGRALFNHHSHQRVAADQLVRRDAGDQAAASERLGHFVDEPLGALHFLPAGEVQQQVETRAHRGRREVQRARAIARFLGEPA